MKDLTKIYIDLSKCTEEQQKYIISLLPKPIKGGDFIINEHHSYLHFDNTLTYPRWYVDYDYYNKTELTYPEFIKLFEGGEDNNGWIKIESESDLPKDEKFWICTSDDRVLISSKAVLNWILKNENNKITHYQPIIKPEPP